MTIKSSFKDYYDSVGFGFDEHDKTYQGICYVRIPAESFMETQLQLTAEALGGFECERACIFVCGRAYPFLYERDLITENIKGIRTSKVFNEVVKERQKEYFNKIWFSAEEYELDLDNKSKETEKYSKYNKYWMRDEKKGRESFFDFYKGKDFTILHLQVDCPLIMMTSFPSYYKGKNMTNMTIIKNPCLREIDFARIMPPTTIYQEIEMFLGNVLVKDIMPPSYQSDIDKVVSHGFDPKISFRNRKNTV